MRPAPESCLESSGLSDETSKQVLCGPESRFKPLKPRISGGFQRPPGFSICPTERLTAKRPVLNAGTLCHRCKSLDPYPSRGFGGRRGGCLNLRIALYAQLFSE